MVKKRRIPFDTPCRTCLHEKLVHATSMKGRNNGQCFIKGCDCPGFIAPPKGVQRLAKRPPKPEPFGAGGMFR